MPPTLIFEQGVLRHTPRTPPPLRRSESGSAATLLRRGFAAALPMLMLALAVPLEAAAIAPDLSFRRIDGRRCRVIYHQGLETMARQAASLADRILDAHTARYGNRVGQV